MWSVPDGFKVAAEPENLDKSLVGSTVYMRWETYGWQLGRITDVVTDATPRLFKKFNYRMVWGQTRARGQRVFALKITRLVQMRASTRGSSWSRIPESLSVTDVERQCPSDIQGRRRGVLCSAHALLVHSARVSVRAVLYCLLTVE